MIVKEELWKLVDWPRLYVVTTNGVIKPDGSMVMGRGAAKQAVKRIPMAPWLCGGAATACTAILDGATRYGFMVVMSPYRKDRSGFGVFQVKYNFSEKADFELIQFSVHILKDWAAKHCNVNVRMNYPGIGNGGLTMAEVEPLLSPLPDNVTICWR